MKQLMVGGGIIVTLLTAAMITIGAAAAGLATGGLSAGPGLPGPPATVAGVPPPMLALYVRASQACPGLSWAVLAAIGTVESDNGRSAAPGVHSGANPAGAEGPMQFEPATFAAYDHPVPPGGVRPPSPYDPVDAVYAAARYLCASGATRPAGLPGAIFAYNHSGAYVAEVLALARRYSGGGSPPSAGTVAVVASLWALGQLGTPYRWGGETPGVGFDCSGLVQAAYAAAGVSLPRVAQAQFDAGPAVPGGEPLVLGDLVFFGVSVTAVDHVGIYLGQRDGAPVMVDAPHSGAVVRIDTFPDVVGSAWGSERYLGATRPAG